MATLSPVRQGLFPFSTTLTFEPQLPISPYHKGSEEQEDKGTKKPETQDDQGEQEERNHVVWETRKKTQEDNKKKGTCFKPSSPQF